MTIVKEAFHDSGGSSEDQNADRTVDRKECAHEISEEKDSKLEKKLEDIYVTFWQRYCLHCAQVL